MGNTRRFGKLFARDTEWKIVEKKKIFFIASSIFFALAIIIFLIFGAKLGIDYQGGYVLEVEYSSNYISDGNREDVAKELVTIIEGLKKDDGEAYGIKVTDYTHQGTGSTRSVRLRFLSLGTDSYMEEALPDIEKKLQEAVKVNDFPHLVVVKEGGSTSATVSSELILNAILAVVISLAAMMIYVSLRYEFVSALAAIVALLHDVLFMFAFMIFARIELNGTFMAALITIIAYSINDTLVMFDRVRENMENPEYKEKSPSWVMNLSVKETFTRTIYTSATTFVSVLLLVVIGVPSIKIFTIPILAGLVAGIYSTLFMSSSIWALVKEHQLKRGKLNRGSNVKKEKKIKPTEKSNMGEVIAE